MSKLFSNHLFRCSSIGYLMTEPRSKKDQEQGNLSETAKSHLIDVFISTKYGRKKDTFSKYMDKGLKVEEDSITLYSRYKKQFFKKNDLSVKNDLIIGTPDMYHGESIMSADHIVDIKSSWDMFTFMRNLNSVVDTMYYWQLQGYMSLTGANTATIAYCLVDTPEVLISDEERRLMWKMGVISEEDQLFKDARAEIRKNMTYADIPIAQRVIEVSVVRDEQSLLCLEEKIHRARVFLNALDDQITSKS